ncbi:MAG: hypothetical protein LBK65_06530 [Tannerellaceae bacterium]|jgi:predicted RNase H-like HicB family nuclease|nr:hypothetical protein [Tannerellaceae bacterium]
MFTQGLTVDELKKNIADALGMYSEDMRKSYEPHDMMTDEEEIVFIKKHLTYS